MPECQDCRYYYEPDEGPPRCVRLPVSIPNQVGAPPDWHVIYPEVEPEQHICGEFRPA